jgi:N-acetylmuramoyl-L-alanine amidase-like protein
MKRAQPRSLSRRRIQRLLSIAASGGSAGARIEAVSKEFLGLPYSSTLVGSAEEAEIFVASLDKFDCVTYIETVLSIACTSNTSQFAEFLRHLRYDRGRVAWDRRNHYMTQWIRNNRRNGTLREISARVPGRTQTRVLNIIRGLPALSARFKCVPKQAIKRFASQLQTGDLIFFASTRKHLDVFHCGLLIREGGDLRMRHASRSRQSVVEQDLDEFLKSNRMAGVIVVRPTGDPIR